MGSIFNEYKKNPSSFPSTKSLTYRYFVLKGAFEWGNLDFDFGFRISQSKAPLDMNGILF